MTLLALLLASIPSLPLGDDELPDGNKLVQVSLLADREAVKPGGTMTLAVRYTIEPEWHVYWENPGDAGVPTRAQFTAPEGWKIGEVRFPAPHRHDVPGDITTYIFERELVLLADVTIPADAKPGSKVTIGVEGRWLVCMDLCVPGSGKSSLEIAIADAEKPANMALFTAARAKLPRAIGELQKARVTWSGTEAEPRLSMIVPGAKSLEYFPLDVEPMSLSSRTIDSGKSGATLRALFEFDRKDPKDEPRIRGVLTVTTDAGVTNYRIDHLFVPPPAGQ